jgi:predicted nucleotide-binding protein (sugar kinase/HSP70/actin superfamily)
MKKTHTILAPGMLDIHFELIRGVMSGFGYNLELLNNQGPGVVREGLRYVHNDTCYPALLVIGQMIDALKSGRYDVERTALMITQTGGGCRASNYIHLLRKALCKAGFEKVPVISLNLSGLEPNSGFRLTLPMLRRLIAALVYGDILMLLRNQTRPYEKEMGVSDRLVSWWQRRLSAQMAEKKGFSLSGLRRNLMRIADDFARVPTGLRDTVKVGVVGEIYIKYASLGNNGLESFLAGQGCEVMVPGVMSFMLFKVDNRLEDIRLYGGNPAKKLVVGLLMDYLTRMESALLEAVRRYPQFLCPSPYQHTKKLVEGVNGYGNKMGEGWLLTAEMLELIELGYGNIVCAQPFGCLPNHISGKAMIGKLGRMHETANIVPIDYDPSATRVNQENRIKLMLAIARENAALREKEQGQLPAGEEFVSGDQKSLTSVAAR